MSVDAGPVTAALFYLPLGGWVLLEISVRVLELVRGRGRRGHDRGTRVVIAVLLGGAIEVAVHAMAWAPSLRMPGRGGLVVAGLILIWVGLFVRVWAVVVLGASFRTTVEVDAGQPVVSRGPYRWVRHPSYTGLLTMVLGLGLGIGNWLALAACVVLPSAALLWRIRVEEAELTRVLGDDYRAYRLRTKRLLPRVW